MKRVSVLVITTALIMSVLGCPADPQPTPVIQYELTISSTEGGSVTTPGERAFTCNAGDKVKLIAIADDGYQFASWTGDVGTVANADAASTTITMNGDYSITASFAVKQYNLITRSTEGGSVTAPGEAVYTYDKGDVVNLAAVADEGYVFINWTGDVSTVADISADSTTITMNGGYSITANFAKGIWTWYDLDAIRHNLTGSYVLMNDLDSETAGYRELASPAANDGRGWQPIAGLCDDQFRIDVSDPVDAFIGSFRGQRHEIRDLFVDQPDADCVGLFGFIGGGAIVQDVGLANATVTGRMHVGGLVGGNRRGMIINSYCVGTVTGESGVGGLVGYHGYAGTIDDSHAVGRVAAHGGVGGLVGWQHYGTMRNSYAATSVTGQHSYGGLVGASWHGTVSNCHYDYDEVLINGKNVITLGALFSEDFQQWLANDKLLDISERLLREDGYYVVASVSDFKRLLAFGQDATLRFRLTDDLDLGPEPNLYIPHLAAEFDGNGHKVSNLSLDLDSVSAVGLFGYLAPGGKVTRLGLENAEIITAGSGVGGLVGFNDGTVTDCYSTGSVAGERDVGGLVGAVHEGTVRNSYSSGNVTGTGSVGGLVGFHFHGLIENSHYNYDEVLVNGEKRITVGALFGEDFEQWLANNRSLDVNEKLSREDGYYSIVDLDDFRHLLAFGQYGSLRFRLQNDLDLSNEAGFYIPHLAGEFDGNGYRISNLSLKLDSAAQVGLFGYLARGGRVTNVSVENASVTGDGGVGGLVGHSYGTVSKSYASGSISGRSQVGGVVGQNRGTIDNCYSSGSIIGGSLAGGLVGDNFFGTIRNSYSVGRVTGEEHVGGLVGQRVRGTVSFCFWDRETSGIEVGAGGRGMTTIEMKNIATFAGWSIVAVAEPGTRNTAYTWNIVDGQTYPFLSWQQFP